MVVVGAWAPRSAASRTPADALRVNPCEAGSSRACWWARGLAHWAWCISPRDAGRPPARLEGRDVEECPAPAAAALSWWPICFITDAARLPEWCRPPPWWAPACPWVPARPAPCSSGLLVRLDM